MLEVFSSDDFLVKNKKRPSFSDGKLTITDIKQAVKNQNRANIFINGKYSFSLDIFQLTELNVKVGRILTQNEIEELKNQSEFSKLYALGLNYCLMRPHSEKEVRDYFYKKTLNRRLKNRKTGEFYEKKGYSKVSAEMATARLIEKGYIDDEKFARFWLENRNQRKGSSLKKLKIELIQKGISNDIIEKIFAENLRNDSDEIKKIIKKKSKKYSDENKLIAYLLRQGFSYDEIKNALKND